MSTSKRVSQVNINKAVMKFVVEGLQPFSVVDLQAFKDLIQDLQPNAIIMSRPTLRSSIAEATKSMKKKLIAAMSEVEYIATTTDCWTTRRRSFIGITAHWLDPDSLDSSSPSITTTDNGSNFLKAFRIYGDQDENNNATYTEELSNSGEGDDDEEEIQEEEEVVNYQEVALWNKSALSALAAETIQDACKLQLIRPNATRWNSMFLAVERLVRIVKEQGEGAIRDVCTSLKIPILNPTELGPDV
ncbi:hypothetical protein F2P79_020466 [Pimephales promelas]|nr:hypothetical protein F2P79_020466 [Pimephales promelas]